MAFFPSLLKNNNNNNNNIIVILKHVINKHYLTMSKNQYGRRVWDVEEYAKRAGVPEEKKQLNQSLSNDSILRQIDPLTQKLTKDDWFRCDLCNRRFKDSIKLADHISGGQHLVNLAKQKTEPLIEPDLESVKAHLRKLKSKLDKQGWLPGIGLNGSTEERIQRQLEVIENSRAKKQKLSS